MTQTASERAAPVLVTGAAGFIGYHFADRLLSAGRTVIGLDNLSAYYDIQLKRDRLTRLQQHPAFTFLEMDVADRLGMGDIFRLFAPPFVVHLAAQAGVRYSLENPQIYVESNIVGFANILEGCRHFGVKHLIYASSSSVYGANAKVPFSEHASVDHPVSLYAATKRANELFAHTYSHLFGLPTTGLRFFTVYGPWGRPDMALFLFTKAILAEQPIDVFNRGDLERDFTYIDDILEGMARLLDAPPPTGDPSWSAERPDPAASAAPFRIFNIGHAEPVPLGRFIEVLEDALGKKAIRNLCPMQPGDVPRTYADVSDLEAAVGYRPRMPIAEGIGRFVAWYREYYGV